MPVKHGIQRDIDIVFGHDDLASNFLDLDLDIDSINSFREWVDLWKYQTM